MSGTPSGFRFDERRTEVAITHHRRHAVTLRGAAASRFLAAVDAGEDEQELMARVTGQYRRGNERTARSHPRNS